MWKQNEINSFVNYFYGQAQEKKLEFASEISELFSKYESTTDENTLAGLFTGVKDKLKAFVADCCGEYAPSYPVYYLAVYGSLDDANNKYATITVRNKLGDDVSYKAKETFKFDNDGILNMINFYIDSLVQVYYREFSNVNIVALNDVMKVICANAGLDFTIQFAQKPATLKEGYIKTISDKEVVLYMPTDVAMDAISLSMLPIGESYADSIVETKQAKFIEKLQGITSVVMLLKSISSLPTLKAMMGIKTFRKRPDNMIALAYRNVTGIRTENEKVAYVKHNNICSVIKYADGKVQDIILTPFDYTTGLTVDDVDIEKLVVDAIAEAKQQAEERANS